MFRILLRLCFVCAIALPFFQSSCAPAKSYYLLTPEGPAPSGGGRGIGVGPVSLAAYLDRPNLVFREGSNRFAVAESHRWAGDLEDNISSVLAANLLAGLFFFSLSQNQSAPTTTNATTIPIKNSFMSFTSFGENASQSCRTSTGHFPGMGKWDELFTSVIQVPAPQSR